MVTKAKTTQEPKVEQGKQLVESDKPNNLPAILSNMEEMAGAGFEGMGADDIAIPFTNILQSGSPQVKRGDPAKIEGASEGDIFNNVTMEVFKGDAGVEVIPCAYQKRYIEWKPREAGGGLVMIHDNDSILQQCTKDEMTGRFTLPNGNNIVPTAYHYILVVKDGGYQRAVISMASTQLKVSRRWNAQMQSIQLPRANGQGKYNPPMFSHSYRLTTGMDSNDRGSWAIWAISGPTVLNDADLWSAAIQFNKAINGGLVKTAQPEGPAAEATVSSEHM